MYKYLGILYFIIGDKKKATNLFIKSIDLKLLQIVIFIYFFQ